MDKTMIESRLKAITKEAVELSLESGKDFNIFTNNSFNLDNGLIGYAFTTSKKDEDTIRANVYMDDVSVL